MGTANQEAERMADMLSDVAEQAIRLQEQAQTAVQELQKSISTLDTTSAKAVLGLNSVAQALPSRIEGALETQLSSAARGAAQTMTEHWGKANRAADRATQAYKASLNQVFLLSGIALGSGVILGSLLTAWLLGRL